MNSPTLEGPQPKRRTPNPRVRVLLITTKCPWPAVDGGRLLVAQTLRALDPQAVEVTLAGPWPAEKNTEVQLREAFPVVSQVISAPAPHSTATAFARRVQTALQTAASLITARTPPATALKHLHSSLRTRLVELLATSTFDVIHLEQPHAYGPLPATNIPILLRAQNVEADLWRRYAAALPWTHRWLVTREAQAVARWERRVARRAHLVLAISEEDQLGFERLGVSPQSLRWLPPAQPLLPPGATSPSALTGAPSLVLFGGSSWKPNQLGEQAFLASAWPAIVRREPSAVLHAFGLGDDPTGPSIIHHPAPVDSSLALVEGSVLVVPATVTSGVRMKILEAFARGLCVVTTEAGARGLSEAARDAVVIADVPDQWASSVAALATAEARRRHAKKGRLALRLDHDPTRVAEQLRSYYLEARNNP